MMIPDSKQSIFLKLKPSHKCGEKEPSATKNLRQQIGRSMKAIIVAAIVLGAATTSASAQFDASQVAAFVSGATLNGKMAAN